MMQKKTKIVATIGPSCDTPEMVEKLITAGVNVFRFNMKHADIPWHKERITMVQKVADKIKTSVGILIDLQGPELRLETRNKEDVKVSANEKMIIASNFKDAEVKMCIPHGVFFKSLEVGDTVLVDDGFVEFSVVEKRKGSIVVTSAENCTVKHRKGVNLPGKKIDLPSLIDDDLLKLDMAAKNKVDFVALSFSRTKKDVEVLREEMKKRNVKAMIIVKTENQEALDNIDELIDITDGLMVARGDLGIEVPIEQLAYWQKYMIEQCRLKNKPVITATQMLQSMCDSPRPTRAEACDVANAVFDGTDAVMLSGESANGKFPLKAVEQMARITKYTEKRSVGVKIEHDPQDYTELVVHAAAAMLDNSDNHNHPKIDKILVFTETGRTARLVSSLRPELPIIAVSQFRNIVEQLTLSFGIDPYCIDYSEGEYSLPKKTFDILKKQGVLEKGDQVLVLHGTFWKKPGMTNTVAVIQVE